MSRAWPVVALLLLAACEDNDMVEQAKILPYERGVAEVTGSLLAPDGAVARDSPEGLGEPPPVDERLLARGADRFAIFCAPCHGPDGSGRDRVPTIPPPPSFHADRLQRVPAAYFVTVMSRGFGAMYPMAGRIPLSDRWAIAAWIKHHQEGRRP